MGGSGSGRTKAAPKDKRPGYIRKKNDPVKMQILDKIKAIDAICSRMNYDNFPIGNVLEKKIISGEYVSAEEAEEIEEMEDQFTSKKQQIQHEMEEAEARQREQRETWEAEEQERANKRAAWEAEDQEREKRREFQSQYKEDNDHEFDLELDFINNVLIPLICYRFFEVNPYDVMLTSSQRGYLDRIRPERKIMKKTWFNYYLSILLMFVSNLFLGALKVMLGVSYIDFNQWKKEKETEHEQGGYIPYEPVEDAA